MNKYQESLKRMYELLQLIPYAVNIKDLKVLDELVDRATPIKPILNDDVELYEVNNYRCKCGSHVLTDFDYCWHCGKALDWSEDETDNLD